VGGDVLGERQQVHQSCATSPPTCWLAAHHNTDRVHPEGARILNRRLLAGIAALWTP
jgi:hypothetical protein